MFYSHQLLSKKGPLGQVWIAATMQSKINRSRIRKLNIGEICTQVLQPQVPLALRLSGILMRGIVVVYSRKVGFLYHDAHEFLVKIKEATAKKPQDKNILPPGKERARFETVTIQYAPNDISQDWHGRTPMKSNEQILDEDFFVMQQMPLGEQSDESVHLHRLHLNQVTLDDITLDENLARTDHPNTIDGDFQDILLPALDTTVNDFIEMEKQRVYGESQAEPSKGLPEPLLDEFNIFPNNNRGNLENNNSPFSAPQATAISSPHPSPKKRQKRAKGTIDVKVSDATTEISSNIFSTWLQNSEDIVGRISQTRNTDGATIQSMYFLPSLLLSNPTGRKYVSKLPESLCQLYQNQLPMDEAQGSLPSDDSNNGPAMGNQDGTQFVPSEWDLNFEVGVDSVERARAFGNTPSSGGNKSHYDITPGQFPPPEKNLAREEPRLVPEEARKRKRNSRLSNVLQNISPLITSHGHSHGIPSISGGSPNPFSDPFPSGRANPISQYLLEETFTETGHQNSLHDSINNVTASLVQFFREQFLESEEDNSVFLNGLCEGLDRKNAAKMFFQVCVLASNSYLNVCQDIPFGDICLRRGKYL